MGKKLNKDFCKEPVIVNINASTCSFAGKTDFTLKTEHTNTDFLFQCCVIANSACDTAKPIIKLRDQPYKYDKTGLTAKKWIIDVHRMECSR